MDALEKPNPKESTITLASGKEEQDLARKKAEDLRTILGKLKEKNEQAAEQYEVSTLENADTMNAIGGKVLSNPAVAAADENRLRDQAAAESGSEDAASDEAYQTYMSQTARSQMVEELSRSEALRKELAQRIENMPEGTAEERAAKDKLEGMLAESEKPANQKNFAGKDIGDIRPMSAKEAFSMDSNETHQEVRNLLAELDRSQFDQSLLRPESLFDRVKSTHDRSFKSGLVRFRAQRKAK